MGFRTDEASGLEARPGEIEKQSTIKAGGFQVVEYLRGFHVGEQLDRLEFDDDGAAADEIGPVGCAQWVTLVRDGDRMFPKEGNPSAALTQTPAGSGAGS